MAWGSLLLPLFSVFSLTYFLAIIVRLIWKREYKLTRWIALACSLTAIGLLLYTGREASILKARPVLYTYWLPILLFFSAMQVVPTLLALGSRREPVHQRELAMWFVSSLILLAVCMGFWITGNTLSGEAIRQQLVMGSLGWWSAIGVAILWCISMAMGILMAKQARSVAFITVMAFISMGLAWVLRWLMLMGSQYIPKYNIITNPYEFTLGNDGLMAIVGTFALWIALTILLRESVRWVVRRVQHG